MSGAGAGAATGGFRSFEAFWAHYVREHGRRGNRLLHFLGTGLGLLCLPAAAVLREPWVIVLGPVLGYGLSWIGHFVVERNRPATFGHPVWSMRSDFRMFGLMLVGRMGEEARRHAGERRA